MLSLFNQLRWADIVIILIIGRCIYIGIKRGLAVEFFKLLGTLLAVFTCLHYYSKLGAFLSKPEIVPTELGNFVAFIFIWSIFLFFSFIIREMFLFLIKLQPLAVLDKWGGAFLGGIRSLFLSGMILLILMISQISFFDKGAKTCFFGQYAIPTVTKTYAFVIERLINPFFSSEKINEEIFRTIEK
ncbi:MAG: CvpA family protein [Candidatus Omnitrophota bacterium]